MWKGFATHTCTQWCHRAVPTKDVVNLAWSKLQPVLIIISMYRISLFKCRVFISYKDNWNKLLKKKKKRTRLFAGLNLLAFCLLVHHPSCLSYFYHSGIYDNKSGSMKIGRAGVFLEEAFNWGNTVFQFQCYIIHCIPNVRWTNVSSAKFLTF